METPTGEHGKLSEPFLTSSPSKGGFRTLPFILGQSPPTPPSPKKKKRRKNFAFNDDFMYIFLISCNFVSDSNGGLCKGGYRWDNYEYDSVFDARIRHGNRYSRQCDLRLVSCHRFHTHHWCFYCGFLCGKVPYDRNRNHY